MNGLAFCGRMAFSLRSNVVSAREASGYVPVDDPLRYGETQVLPGVLAQKENASKSLSRRLLSCGKEVLTEKSSTWILSSSKLFLL